MAARTFGVSPAQTYLGLSDPLLVAAIDEALAVRLVASQSSEKPPPGQRFASEDEYPPDEPE